MTSVSQAMTRGVRTISPADSLMLAAQAMEELNVGSLPVCDGSNLMGILTDRDIVTRAVAQGCPLDGTRVSDVMSQNVQWCFEDQSVEEVADRMGQAQIRRLPVLDRDRQLVGMLSLGDMATKTSQQMTARTLESISEPAAPERSGQARADTTGMAAWQAGAGQGTSPSTYLQDEQRMPAGPDSQGTKAAEQAAH